MQALIATLIALAVAALGVVEAMQHSDSLFGTSKVTGQVTDIADLMAHSKQKMGALPSRYSNFSTSSAPSLAWGGIVPATMFVNGQLLNRWGGSITLSNTSNGGAAVLTTTWPDVTTCSDMVTSLGSYTTLTIGSSVFTPMARPDPVTATNACSAGLTMTLTWS